MLAAWRVDSVPGPHVEGVDLVAAPQVKIDFPAVHGAWDDGPPHVGGQPQIWWRDEWDALQL